MIPTAVPYSSGLLIVRLGLSSEKKSTPPYFFFSHRKVLTSPANRLCPSLVPSSCVLDPVLIAKRLVKATISSSLHYILPFVTPPTTAVQSVLFLSAELLDRKAPSVPSSISESSLVSPHPDIPVRASGF